AQRAQRERRLYQERQRLLGARAVLADAGCAERAGVEPVIARLPLARELRVEAGRVGVAGRAERQARLGVGDRSELQAAEEVAPQTPGVAEERELPGAAQDQPVRRVDRREHVRELRILAVEIADRLDRLRQRVARQEM